VRWLHHPSDTYGLVGHSSVFASFWVDAMGHAALRSRKPVASHPNIPKFHVDSGMKLKGMFVCGKILEDLTDRSAALAQLRKAFGP
jgi:hypothetical protein